jgi:hypothetical protein
VTALPCKVRDPDRKGKVESGVNHAQMTPLKGKKFESLEQAQAYLDHWEEHWGRQVYPRSHQAAGSGDVRRREVFFANAAAGAVPPLPVWRGRT